MSDLNNKPMTKQYYETVDVATGELPEVDNWYIVITEGNVANDFHWHNNEWNYTTLKMPVSDKVVTAWLRPVDLSELIREVAAGGWDACRNWVVDESCPDKTEYINSLIK